MVDTVTGAIDCGPPEPQDVAPLMADLFAWLHSPAAAALPAPVRTGILTHRFLSIHPFDDGNGRSGRLLATVELWRSHYRMRGFLSFDEYFSADRARYYATLQMGLPVNFYEGRHDPDHTPWLEYFAGILAKAADSLHQRAANLQRAERRAAPPWEEISRQEEQVLTRLLSRALEAVPRATEIQAADIEAWFGVSGNTAREWLRQWTTPGLLTAIRGAGGVRVRRYRLALRWARLIEQAKQRRPDSTSPGRAAVRVR